MFLLRHMHQSWKRSTRNLIFSLITSLTNPAPNWAIRYTAVRPKTLPTTTTTTTTTTTSNRPNVFFSNNDDEIIWDTTRVSSPIITFVIMIVVIVVATWWNKASFVSNSLTSNFWWSKSVLYQVYTGEKTLIHFVVIIVWSNSRLFLYMVFDIMLWVFVIIFLRLIRLCVE